MKKVKVIALAIVIAVVASSCQMEDVPGTLRVWDDFRSGQELPEGVDTPEEFYEYHYGETYVAAPKDSEELARTYDAALFQMKWGKWPVYLPLYEVVFSVKMTEYICNMNAIETALGALTSFKAGGPWTAAGFVFGSVYLKFHACRASERYAEQRCLGIVHVPGVQAAWLRTRDSATTECRYWGYD